MGGWISLTPSVKIYITQIGISQPSILFVKHFHTEVASKLCTLRRTNRPKAPHGLLPSDTQQRYAMCTLASVLKQNCER